MKVHVFGNDDVPGDGKALDAARKLEHTVDGVYFVFVGPNEDVPFAYEPSVVILDAVPGIGDVTVIEAEEIEELLSCARGSAHDYDLAFQLRYLSKIGKLGKVTVVGVPGEVEVDHLRLQSILRKLVAQDMQGS